MYIYAKIVMKGLWYMALSFEIPYSIIFKNENIFYFHPNCDRPRRNYSISNHHLINPAQNLQAGLEENPHRVR